MVFVNCWMAVRAQLRQERTLVLHVLELLVLLAFFYSPPSSPDLTPSLYVCVPCFFSLSFLHTIVSYASTSFFYFFYSLYSLQHLFFRFFHFFLLLVFFIFQPLSVTVSRYIYNTLIFTGWIFFS